MSIQDKDPYLSELESLEGLEEPTHVDTPASPPAGSPAKKEGKPEAAKKEAQEKKGMAKPPFDSAQGKSSKKLVSELAPDIPLQVSAVLGSRELTMRELSSLEMGEVVDLGCPPNQVVDLMVSGQVVAKGELVEIEGKLGVRILKVL